MQESLQKLMKNWYQLGSGTRVLVIVLLLYIGINTILDIHESLKAAYLDTMQPQGAKALKSDLTLRDAKELQQLPPVKRTAEVMPVSHIHASSEDLLQAFFPQQPAQPTILPTPNEVPALVKAVIEPPKVYRDPILDMHLTIQAKLNNGIIMHNRFYPYGKHISALSYFAPEKNKMIAPYLQLRDKHVVVCGYKDCQLLG
ncbi:MAG: hypothetical protein JHC38_00805 [Thiotrichales bacterium]|jgi:hypothetical protein|nr:hypothetical protein [Thiotrichales bacterium]